MSTTWRNWSGVSRVAGTAVPIPALLTSTSTLPSSATVRSTTFVHWSGSDTSHSTATQRRRWPSTIALVSCRRSTRRAQIATSAPAWANASANDTPRPDDAPVTMATLPSRRKASRMLMAARLSPRLSLALPRAVLGEPHLVEEQRDEEDRGDALDGRADDHRRVAVPAEQEDPDAQQDEEHEHAGPDEKGAGHRRGCSRRRVDWPLDEPDPHARPDHVRVARGGPRPRCG